MCIHTYNDTPERVLSLGVLLLLSTTITFGYSPAQMTACVEGFGSVSCSLSLSLCLSLSLSIPLS